MVSGLVQLDQAVEAPVEVRRDMAVFTYDGRLAGKVAAVVLDADGGDTNAPI